MSTVKTVGMGGSWIAELLGGCMGIKKKANAMVMRQEK